MYQIFRGMNMQSIKVHINAIIKQKPRLMDNTRKNNSICTMVTKHQIHSIICEKYFYNEQLL